MSFEFETDDYMDGSGRKWRCVAQPKRDQMICHGEDGSYTVASFQTFAVWGWKPTSAGKTSALPDDR